MAFRECFHPDCENDSENSPGKMFVRITENVREEWCRKVGAQYYKVYTQYCCEDHFDPQEELINYYQYKFMNKEPKLKSNAKLKNNNEASELGDSSELRKLLLLPNEIAVPWMRKHQDINYTPSTSTHPKLPAKVHAATQVNIRMVDKSTNFKARKKSLDNTKMVDAATQVTMEIDDKNTNYKRRKKNCTCKCKCG